MRSDIKRLEDALRELAFVLSDDLRRTVGSEAIPKWDLSASELLSIVDTVIASTRAAIDTGRVEALPRESVRTLASHLSAVSNGIKSNPVAPTWCAAAMTLQRFAWEFGITRPDQIPVDGEAASLARTGVEYEKRLAQIQGALPFLDELQKSKERMDKAAQQILEHAKTAETLLSNIRAKDEAADREAKSAVSHANHAGAQAAAATAKKAAVDEFASTIEATRKRLSELEAAAGSAATEYQSRVVATKEWSEKQGEVVAKLIEHATGASLFGAFDKRATSLAWWAKFWAVTSIIVGVGIVGFVIWLASGVKSGEVASEVFWIRLSSLPLALLLLGFAISQYSRSKSLEDAYAFKASLSLSLEPYKNLVSELLKQKGDGKHLDFVVETIRQIYSPPDGERPRRSWLTKTEASLVSDAIKTISEGLPLRK